MTESHKNLGMAIQNYYIIFHGRGGKLFDSKLKHRPSAVFSHIAFEIIARACSAAIWALESFTRVCFGAT